MSAFTAGPNGSVPGYEERAEQLLAEAARLLRVYSHDGDGRDTDTERWLEHYALHTSQTDHPDVRSESHT